jgi:hypothetical protein
MQCLNCKAETFNYDVTTSNGERVGETSEAVALLDRLFKTPGPPSLVFEGSITLQETPGRTKLKTVYQ